MDILIRLVKKSEDSKGLINEFNSLSEVQKYFCTLANQDYYFFYITSINEIRKGDKIYFTYPLTPTKVIATAIYTGNKIDKKDKFNNGYQLEKIKLMCPPIKINNSLFGQQVTYIKTAEDTNKYKEKKAELEKVD